MGNVIKNFDVIHHILKHFNVHRLNFVENNIKMSKKRTAILEKCNSELEKSFNIFRDLSIDSKFNEINHSKMLKKILSYDTPDIGNREYFNIFIKLIEKIKESKINYYFDNGFTVEREVGRTNDIKESGGIDILISDDKYCIIIENKITGKADDKENQLARYYNIAMELNKKPLAIVYIPFYFKRPPIYNYTNKYKNHIKIIHDLLVVLPAWDPREGNDLTHGYLDVCSEYAKAINNITALVCFDQYSKFIKGKGDLDQMATNEDKEFVERVLSNREMKKTVEDIIEIWENHTNIMGEIFLDYLIENNNFKNINEYHGKMLNNDIFIYFEKDFQIGFGSISGNIKKGTQEKLKKLLKNDAESINFENSDKEWVWGKLKEDSLKGNINDMKIFISSKIVCFEENGKKLL